MRTAWDLWLQAMAFPRGSEIIVSSITIPEMARIIELAGLVVVPVPVDPLTLARSSADRTGHQRAHAGDTCRSLIWYADRPIGNRRGRAAAQSVAG